MKTLIRIGVVASLAFALGACGNSDSKDSKAKDSAETPATSESASPSATPSEESVTTDFIGNVDLQSKQRKIDSNGNCNGTGPNADLRAGAKIAIFDKSGAEVATATLKRGTVMPTGDDGPQVCRFPFSTEKVQAVGRDFTAKVGSHEAASFNIDDSMDITVQIR